MNIKGVGIGRGVAVGPVIRMAAPLPEPSDAPRAESISAETEIARVEKSLALVNADLNRRAEEAANGDEGAKQAAPILQAIAMFASDPSLAQSIKDLINQGKTAERAVLEGFGAVEDMFRAIGGYQAERAADLHDVGQRVIADLMGAPAPGLPVSETPFVLVAEDLSPADTAALDMSKTLAIVPPRAVRPPTPPFWRAPVASSRSSPPPKPPNLRTAPTSSSTQPRVRSW